MDSQTNDIALRGNLPRGPETEGPLFKLTLHYTQSIRAYIPLDWASDLIDFGEHNYSRKFSIWIAIYLRRYDIYAIWTSPMSDRCVNVGFLDQHLRWDLVGVGM